MNLRTYFFVDIENDLESVKNLPVFIRSWLEHQLKVYASDKKNVKPFEEVEMNGRFVDAIHYSRQSDDYFVVVVFFNIINTICPKWPNGFGPLTFGDITKEELEHLIWGGGAEYCRNWAFGNKNIEGNITAKKQEKENFKKYSKKEFNDDYRDVDEETKDLIKDEVFEKDGTIKDNYNKPTNEKVKNKINQLLDKVDQNIPLNQKDFSYLDKKRSHFESLSHGIEAMSESINKDQLSGFGLNEEEFYEFINGMRLEHMNLVKIREYAKSGGGANKTTLLDMIRHTENAFGFSIEKRIKHKALQAIGLDISGVHYTQIKFHYKNFLSLVEEDTGIAMKSIAKRVATAKNPLLHQNRVLYKTYGFAKNKVNIYQYHKRLIIKQLKQIHKEAGKEFVMDNIAKINIKRGAWKGLKTSFTKKLGRRSVVKAIIRVGRLFLL